MTASFLFFVLIFNLIFLEKSGFKNLAAALKIIEASVFLWLFLSFIFLTVIKPRLLIYEFCESGIEIKKGLFVKTEIFIPFNKITHISREIPLFYRQFGLVNIYVSTSSGVYQIEGLKGSYFDMIVLQNGKKNEI